MLKARRSGAIDSKLDVHFRLGEQAGVVSIPVRADVREWYWISPLAGTIPLGEIELGRSFVDQYVKLEWLAERDLEVRRVRVSKPEGMRITREDLADGDRRGVELRVQFLDPLALLVSGDIARGGVVIETTDPLLPEVTFGFEGRLRQPVVVLPRTVALPAQGDDAIVRIGAAPGFGLKLTDLRMADARVTVRVVEEASGSLFAIRLRRNAVEPGAEPLADRAMLEIHTNFAPHPVFRVPVRLPR